MTKPLTLSVGEVLWDILPDGKALGGATANAAWHLAQLGADARVVSAVGDDPLGREILDRLAAMGFDTATVAVAPHVPTSTVDAVLDAAGNATYTIHENVAWDYIPATPQVLALAARARAVNFGSLAQRHDAARAATHAILDAVPSDAVRVFDVNLRPPHFSRDVLDAGLRRATVVKMNHDELPVVAGLLGWTGDPDDAARRLFAAYPNVGHLVMTLGADGARWLTADGVDVRQAPPPPAALADTIGAGDSVTAATMAGLLRGWEPARILAAAMALASYVCSCRGGTPELPEAVAAPFRD